MNKEVITSYPIKCVGAPSRDGILKLTGDLSSAEVSLTIYKDGKRDVGCSFISDQICNKFRGSLLNGRCRHLFPSESLD